jgi:hypothetical protein
MGDTPEKENILMYYRNFRIIDKDVKNYATEMNYPEIDLLN